MSQLLTATVAEVRETWQVSRYQRLFFLAIALMLLTIGAASRIYHLGNRSLWFDEALTANTSRSTLAHMIEATRSRGSAPVVHPYILYIVEKLDQKAVAVRAPSVLASLLAILLMLGMVRANVSRNAVLFAAAILTVSASQIRYAQEVREYSFAVMFATLLIYCFLRWEATGSRSRQPVLLYAVLFLVPLVQYGLVLFAASILSTIALCLVFTRGTRFRLSHLVIAAAFLGAGGLLSFVLTLRYQFQPGKGQWYLVSNYFDPKTTSLLRFSVENSKGLLSFFMPGQVVAVCFVIAAVIFCVARAFDRKVDPIMLLVFSSVAIVLLASIAKLYPYGGIRQCLFLAPGLTLFAGVVLADLLKRVKMSWEPIVTLGFLAVILFSGCRGLRRQWPYGEYEDTQSILKKLDKLSAPSDEVWVNHDAVEAVDFYLQGKDPRFVYGKFHRDPNDYIPELSAEIDPHRERIWLVFSHLQQPSDHFEKELIVSSLRSRWDVQEVLEPKNTELFLARRKISR
jgi:4-amino-4-deoxy-L-arabinose transferase-like glycosyltransferase